MRRLLALVCCATYLAFGLVAGAAHQHQSGDHHAQARGLHVDHAHMGHSTGQAHQHRHQHPSPHDGDARSVAGHAEHHEGDVLYLNAPALGSPVSTLRLLPATVSAAAAIDPPDVARARGATAQRQPKEPPRKRPTRPRAPPV